MRHNCKLVARTRRGDGALRNVHALQVLKLARHSRVCRRITAFELNYSRDWSTPWQRTAPKLREKRIQIQMLYLDLAAASVMVRPIRLQSHFSSQKEKKMVPEYIPYDYWGLAPPGCRADLYLRMSLKTAGL